MPKIITILIVFVTTSIRSQVVLLDSLTLSRYTEYTDLTTALNNKDSVVKLNLRKKKLKEFPVEILQFKNLQYLDISKNNIKHIPDSIVTLTKLQYFACSKTGLENLPKNFGDLENLKYVYLNQNELTILPYSFGRLEKLEHADLWDNNMDEFPASMKELKNLKTLDLRNIIISKTKQEALQQQIPNTKIYFSAPCNCGG